jgi:hypothetical protein
MNLWMYSFDLNTSSCFKISDFQVILSEISETGSRYFLAQTGLLLLLACCCSTCRRSLIHVLDILGVIIQRQAAAAAALRTGVVDQTRSPVSLVVQQPKPAGRNYHLTGRPARSQKPLLPATASQIPE